MRVFLTGATGFIGSAIIQELKSAGHEILGPARSETGAQLLAEAGVEVHRAELSDPESLAAGARAADGVIHCAFVHDFKDFNAAGETDRIAIEAMGEALAGSGKPFVVTSGLGYLASGRVGTEDDPPYPDAPVKHRLRSEQLTLALASRGIGTLLLRLPLVHGDGDPGFVPRFVQIARDKGVSAYVGDGLNCWPAMHRLDVARLYRLALESGSAGAQYYAVGEEGVRTREIAEVIGRRLNLPVVSKPQEAAGEHFGFLGRFWGLDCPASSALTQQRLGWHPTEPGLLADLEHGRYFES